MIRKLIVGNRGFGKTTELVKCAVETGGVVIVMSHNLVRYTEEIYQKIKTEIEEKGGHCNKIAIATWSSIAGCRSQCKMRGIYVDDYEHNPCVYEDLRHDIVAISITLPVDKQTEVTILPVEEEE